MVKPYSQVIENDGTILRTFLHYLDSDELIWHRDFMTRDVTVISGNKWKLQMDNKIPVIMEKGKIYTIKAMDYHRLIKGEGDLVIKIWEK